MALEAHARVRLSHALAIVADLYQRFACILDYEGDGGTAGINGVLHQLLHHRGRPLHHLARGDLIGNAVRK